MVNISDEERQRRRDNMLKLHEEGRAGGQYGKLGGRPKAPRASERIAERVAQKGDDYFERLDEIAMTETGKNAIAALQTLLKIEEQERKIVVEEEDKIDELDRTALLALVSEQLRAAQNSGLLERVINVGNAEVVRDEGLASPGEDAITIEETSEPEGSAD